MYESFWRAVVFTYFISSWCKGSDVVQANCCLNLAFSGCFVFVYVYIFLVVSH